LEEGMIVEIMPIPTKVEPTFETLHSFDNMNDVVLLGAKDSIIYFFRYIDEVRHLSLYDYGKDRVIRDLRLFEDPKHLSDMQYVNYLSFHKDSLGYINYNERIYHCFSYKDLINGIVKYSSSPWMHADSYKPYKYRGKYIVVRAATTDDKTSSHMVYSPEGHKKKCYDFYPRVDLSLNDQYHRQPYQVFWGNPVMNEECGIFVHASQPSNTLTIIGVDEDYKLSVIKQHNNFNPNELTYDESAPKGQLIISYTSSQATDNFFYLAYKGNEYQKDGKSHLLQYDWVGSLVKIIVINGDCRSFAVTPDDSMVYMMLYEEDKNNPQLIKSKI
jgi:hypothetical protein